MTKETSLDIQLEFLDYELGQYINKYNGYYMGTYNNRLLIMSGHYKINAYVNINITTPINNSINMIKTYNNFNIEYDIPDENCLLHLISISKIIFSYEVFNNTNHYLIKNDMFYDNSIKLFKSITKITNDQYQILRLVFVILL